MNNCVVIDSRVSCMNELDSVSLSVIRFWYRIDVVGVWKCGCICVRIFGL